MDIGLFFNPNEDIRGPQKVVNNLFNGLTKLGITPRINEISGLNGCLQSNVPMYRVLPKNTLMGPNLLVTPDNDPSVWTIYKNFVVPSLWVQNLYRNYHITHQTNIYIWSAGIDTDRFNSKNKSYEFDCLLYVKNRNETQSVRNFLDKKNISYREIHYGQYQEDVFNSLLKKCRFCFLLTHTESQGIAYMEILSTNTPCFVWDMPAWNGYPATSTPYFSDECGIKSQTLDEEKFDEFLSNLNTYNPRNYILENHTLEISAKKYLDLISLAHS